jgi:hypothetical protein
MKDATLGGYLGEHERPPAFEGADGCSYTVEILIDSDDGTHRGYLFFLKWEGGGPVGHLESEYLVEADSEELAQAELEKLTLHEVKGVLDKLVSG